MPDLARSIARRKSGSIHQMAFAASALVKRLQGDYHTYDLSKTGLIGFLCNWKLSGCLKLVAQTRRGERICFLSNFAALLFPLNIRPLTISSNDRRIFVLIQEN